MAQNSAASKRKVPPNRRSDQLMIPNTFGNRLRTRIDAAMVLEQFGKCVKGEIEMTSQQIAAGKVLLNKVLPDAQPPKESERQAAKDVKHIPTWKLLEAIDGEVSET